jgi:hypothetical protein
MSTPVILGFLWLLVANLRAMFPSRDNLWRFAYGLMAVGVPILIWITWKHGIWLGVVFLLMAMWVMRWPVIYAVRWLRNMARRSSPD